MECPGNSQSIGTSCVNIEDESKKASATVGNSCVNIEDGSEEASSLIGANGDKLNVCYLLN